jgi:hypothetical protein
MSNKILDLKFKIKQLKEKLNKKEEILLVHIKEMDALRNKNKLLCKEIDHLKKSEGFVLDTCWRLNDNNTSRCINCGVKAGSPCGLKVINSTSTG